MRPLSPELQNLAQRQQGLLTTRQLSSAGFRRRDVDLRTSRGDWTRVSESVIATHGQRLPRRAKLVAASLHFERCALAGASALELLGLPQPIDGRIHIIGPRAGYRSPMAGCVVHGDVKGVEAMGDPMCVAPATAALQALRWAVSIRQGVFHAIWTIQRGLATLEELQMLAREMPKSPGTAQMRKGLAVIDPGVQSMHEFDFARECVKRRLPEPRRQVKRVDSKGRSRYTDVEFRVNGRTLVVEIDGLGHLATEVLVDDQWRANELLLQGAPVLRVPGFALRIDPDPFFEQLGRALAQLSRAA